MPCVIDPALPAAGFDVHSPAEIFGKHQHVKWLNVCFLLCLPIRKKKKDDGVREAPKAHSSLFFQFNSNLKPPYQLS